MSDRLPQRNKLKISGRILLLVLFCVWFGGFTFYTSVVVPVGTDVLGSSRAQGFITRQVTSYLNWIGGVAIALMAVNLFMGWKARTFRQNTVFTSSVILILLLWIVLVLVHPVLDSMLEPEHEYVNDESRFYQWHRVYLWTSTFQWLFCWVWLAALVEDWSRDSKRS